MRSHTGVDALSGKIHKGWSVFVTDESSLYPGKCHEYGWDEMVRRLRQRAG